MSGVRVGVIQQTMGEGVAAGVTAAVNGALQHMQQLGATVEEVSRLFIGAHDRCLTTTCWALAQLFSTEHALVTSLELGKLWRLSC